VELFEQIRRAHRLEGLSIRELADRHGVHRRTVRQALDSAVPPPRKDYERRPRPALDAWVTVIDGWLLADRDAPRKQRHTARRIWQRLVVEHGATLAEVTVSRYVARRRVELGLVDIDVAIPQTHLPGAEAEVDFGEFHMLLAGVDVTVWMFVMRLSHSGGRFIWRSATRPRSPFWRVTSERSTTSVRCQDGSATTTSNRPWCGCCAAATAPSRNGSSRCAATTASTRSSACPE
jgi:transposase